MVGAAIGRVGRAYRPFVTTLQPRRTPGDSSWFLEARFGLFIHWGLYSVTGADGWLKTQRRVGDDVYDRFFERFDPDLFDPELWADAAVDAGMRYSVITAKHHEGFCLWATAQTSYAAPQTPAGRDLLRPWLDAARTRGLRTGLYYSLLDWHHPDFTVDRYHPNRGQDAWGVASEEVRAAADEGKDFGRYVDYAHAQVQELLTQYGRIDILWPDFSYPGKGAADWRAHELVDTARRLQPGILVNDRAGLPPSEYDVTTPEQMVPPSWPQVEGEPALWETCQTISGSWGWRPDDTNWRSVEQITAALVETVSKGGNFLLNVGPTGRGEFDERVLTTLRDIGVWMRRHGRSIYGCTAAPKDVDVPSGCLLTYNQDTRRLYVHVLRWPDTRHLLLPGLKGRIAYAQTLHDGVETRVSDIGELFVNEEDRHLPADTAALRVPFQRPDVPVPVVEIELL